MDILEFDNLSLFKKISLDEETLIIHSKCGKYSFYINFKDEVKGVDYYELAIATETSNGFINKSGTASVINKAIMDTLSGNVVSEDKVTKTKVEAKTKLSNKANNQKNAPLYTTKKGRR
ncbi:MAG: hypothetical protein RRZ84_06150 [Romboutsia sp.]